MPPVTVGKRSLAAVDLGVWIVVPLSFAAVIGLLIYFMPQDACDSASAGARIVGHLIVGLTYAFSLGCLVAAVLQLVALLYRPLYVSGPQLAIATTLIVALAAFAPFVPMVSLATVPWAVWVVGLPATAAVLVVLLVARGFGRQVDDVGFLLPVYLVGVGMFLPTLTLFAAIVKCGIE